MSERSLQGKIFAATVQTTYEQSEGPRSHEEGGQNGRELQGNLEDEDSELEDDDSERASPPWIPLSEVKGVVSAAEDELKTLQLSRVDRDRLQTFISKAQRLCALLIHIDRLHWIEAFCEQNFGDARFPVKIVQKNKNTCTVRRLKTKATLSEASVDIHIAKPDDRTIIHTIEDPHQWFFFPPVFSKSGSPYTFDPRCRLPFLKEITHRATNFSAVTERVIHKSHLDFPKFPNDDQVGTVVDDDGNPHVAVKELTSEKWFGPRFKEVVKNEEAVLVHFQEKKHDHFIKAIARYTQSRKHYFVFPWAKGGNLHDFWEKQPSLSDDCLNFSRETWNTFVKWFFRQILGISGAMKSLHFPVNNPGGSCRHGDLKPENILCFCDVLPGPGQVPTNVKLVIADAGHAKIHQKATEFRPDPTRTPRGTQRYTPPEANNPGETEKPTSRRYDIWSLGCMYLEFLIWILYGYKGLLDFYNDVGNEFFSTTGGNVQVKSQVQDWIDAIKVDPRCAPFTSTAVGRLVHLIEARLLVVNIEIEPKDNTELQEVKDLGTMGTGPKLIIRPPTIKINPEPTLARADAKEMVEEMETIEAAADKGLIEWINWDGMEQASKLGKPQTSDTLLSDKQLKTLNQRRHSLSVVWKVLSLYS
ncbi:hypothetical protein CGLO_05523 [Colletotrichum gloeosporioides Cg-14]|uniref:Protein kinase domain-containing protein n=1 Tax=Colletotrichum gloeosporioides (strain Cg-14) TaxID=1237896 RepID=T0M1H9_COLGC|nr:hypothetical protein CGLO_05523 [Colletotrichum gloeosporioides Cg-14]